MSLFRCCLMIKLAALMIFDDLIWLMIWFNVIASTIIKKINQKNISCIQISDFFNFWQSILLWLKFFFLVWFLNLMFLLMLPDDNTKRIQISEFLWQRTLILMKFSFLSLMSLLPNHHTFGQESYFGWSFFFLFWFLNLMSFLMLPDDYIGCRQISEFLQLLA